MLAGLNITNLAILGQSILRQATAPIFDVLNIPNLRMWVKSNVGVTATGVNRVTGWVDQSTGGLNAVQEDPTLQPLYVSMNNIGLPELVFDGTDDSLRAPALQDFAVGFDYTGAGTYGGFVAAALTGTSAGFFRNRFGINNFGSLIASYVRDEPTAIEMSVGNGSPYRNTTFYQNSQALTYAGLVQTYDPVSATATSSVLFYQPSGNKSFYQKLQGTQSSYEGFDNNTWQFTDLGTPAGTPYSLMEFYASVGAVTTGQVDQLSQNFCSRWLTGMKNFVLYLGDSLTYGYNLGTDSDTYPFKSAAAFNNIDYANAGLVGIKADTISGNPPYYAGLVRPNRKNICVLWIGANDITVDYQPYIAVATIGSGLRSQGYKVVVCTQTPVDYTIYGPVDGPILQANLDLLNGKIRSGYSTFADGLADIAAHPIFTGSGAYNNTNYYMDTIHLTPSGYTIVSGVVNSVIAGLLV